MADVTELLARLGDADIQAEQFAKYLREQRERVPEDTEEWSALDFLEHHYGRLRRHNQMAAEHLKAAGREADTGTAD